MVNGIQKTERANHHVTVGLFVISPHCTQGHKTAHPSDYDDRTSSSTVMHQSSWTSTPFRITDRAHNFSDLLSIVHHSINKDTIYKPSTMTDTSDMIVLDNSEIEFLMHLLGSIESENWQVLENIMRNDPIIFRQFATMVSRSSELCGATM